MQSQSSGAKEPAVAVVLSLCVPGLGHLYAGRTAAFVVFLAGEIWMFSHGWYAPLVVLHVFQAIAAGGAAKLRNQAAPGAGLDVPPPPERGSRPVVIDVPPPPLPAARTAPEPPPPPPLPKEPVVLDADDFLAELQAAWRDYRESRITSREFADRKWRAIRAVRAERGEEGAALVEAARHLAQAGVLTSEEIGMLEARVGA